MKRRWLAIGLLLCLTLTACGGSATKETAVSFNSTTMSGTTADTAYGSSVTYEEAGEVERGEGQITQKLIRTAQLELETTDFDTATAGLTTLVEQYGGYFENTSIYNRNGNYRNADYTIRVPAEDYQGFINQAGALCHELWRHVNQEDITESYYDTEGRLQTQKIKLTRLQTLLGEAENMEDIITIEAAISETEWAIEDLSGTLRHYDALVDYATITISISEVYKLSNVEEVPETFGARLGNAFTNGLRAFGDTMEELAVGFAYSWIWWLLLAIVIVVAVRVVKGKKPSGFSLRRKKKHDNGEEN